MEEKIFNIVRYWIVPFIILFSIINLQYIMIGLLVIGAIVNSTNIYGYKLSKEERTNFILLVFIQLLLMFFAYMTRINWYVSNFFLVTSLWIHIYSTEYIRKKMDWKLPFQK